MSRLEISLLGPFGVHLDGGPTPRFRSDGVRALLAYLCIESDRHPEAHRREALAALLWPDEPERVARQNLRQALSRLRSSIGDREADSNHRSAIDPPRPWRRSVGRRRCLSGGNPGCCCAPSPPSPSLCRLRGAVAGGRDALSRGAAL
jgi:hypothetical protein